MPISTFAVLSSFAISAATAMLSGNATTTRYYDGQKGACGCGTDSGLFSWQTGISSGVYTAAGSQALFDLDTTSGSSWCGGGCGSCFQLTSTGYSPSGSDSPNGAVGAQITVMLTNLCPNSGNERWCPKTGGTNQYGYGYHFDLMSSGYDNPAFFGDNLVVSFEQVDCPSQAVTDFGKCAECVSSMSTIQSTVAGGQGAGPSVQTSPSTVTPTPSVAENAASVTSPTTMITTTSGVAPGNSELGPSGAVAASGMVGGEKKAKSGGCKNKKL